MKHSQLENRPEIARYPGLARAVPPTVSFYDAIAAGCPVDTSVAAARLSMFAERSDDIEWGTPVLFMRAPNGNLFDVSELPPRLQLPTDPLVSEPHQAGIALAA